MSQKTALTIWHGLMAIIITFAGTLFASSIARDNPLSAFALMLILPALPAVIATRISWANGYGAGINAKDSKKPPFNSNGQQLV